MVASLLVIVALLVAGALQVVFGVYLALKKRGEAGKMVLARYCGRCSRVSLMGSSKPRILKRSM